MKKTVALLLAVCVMAFLVGCKEKKKEDLQTNDSTETAKEQNTSAEGELLPAEDTEGENFGAFIPFI